MWVVPQSAHAPQAWSVPNPAATVHFPPAASLTAPEVEPPTDVHLRVTIAESFLSSLLEREVIDSGTIRDCLLGANLYGDQFTVTRLRLDCQPCDAQARVLMRLTGDVHDQTIGVTRPAAVRTEGSHCFEMTKEVNFDGRRFTTRTPAAWVTPRVAVRGATTVVSGVPVIGSIGAAIALNEAHRRRPAVEQYALQRVTRTAAPRFNSEVDKKLAAANQRIAAYGPLLSQRLGVTTDRLILKTSNDCVHYAVRIRSGTPPDRTDQSLPSDVGGPVFLNSIEDAAAQPERFDPSSDNSAVERPFAAPAPIVERRSVTLVLHEDLINEALARAPLGGREVSDRFIDHILRTLDRVITERSVNGLSVNPEDFSAAEFATIVLAADRPLSVSFDAGRMVVMLRAGFRPAVGGDIPVQQIEIPFQISTHEDSLSLEPAGVTISGGPDREDGALDAVARPVIRQQIQKRLRPIVLKRTIPFHVGELRPATLTVRDVVMADGWLAVGLD